MILLLAGRIIPRRSSACWGFNLILSPILHGGEVARHLRRDGEGVLAQDTYHHPLSVFCAK
jgi:hypothetical protein